MKALASSVPAFTHLLSLTQSVGEVSAWTLHRADLQYPVADPALDKPRESHS